MGLYMKLLGQTLLLLFSCSTVSNSFVNPCSQGSQDCSCQTPLSMGFPRQEYWSGLPFPPPKDLANPGTEPESPALVGKFLTSEPPGKFGPNRIQRGEGTPCNLKSKMPRNKRLV